MDKGVLINRKAVEQGYDEVDIAPGVKVVVRALSRGEVQDARAANASNTTYENRLIAAALVDPEMTPAEVGEWLADAPAGDSVKVMTAIADLSGLSEGAPKSRVRAARGPAKRR